MLVLPTAKAVTEGMSGGAAHGAAPGANALGGAAGKKSSRAAGLPDNPFSRLLSALRNPRDPARADAVPADTGGAAAVARRAAGGADAAGKATRNPQLQADDAAALSRQPASPGKNAGLLPPAHAAATAQAEASETGGAAKRDGKRKLADRAGAAESPAAASPVPQARAERSPVPAKADEVREADRLSAAETRKAEPRVSVVDLRLRALKERAAGQDQKESSPDAGMKPASGPEAQSSAPHIALRGPEAEPAAPPRPAAEAPAAAGLSAGLAARLREDGAADIVRAAQVVLRDGDAGMIRLRLEPETLGGVKIELKMAEKQISGRIVVESDLAGEAFRSSLDALRDAFAEAGFETASLEVEVRDGGGSAAGGDGRAGTDSQGPFWSTGFRELGNAVPQAASPGADGHPGLNVLV